MIAQKCAYVCIMKGCNNPRYKRFHLCNFHLKEAREKYIRDEYFDF